MSDKTDRPSAYNEVAQMLENGVKEVFTSERYKEYLNFVSKFYNYSHNNTLLIMLQNPEASFVASYTDWKNKHNRNVKYGEKGLKIIAPSPYKVKYEVPVYDKNKTPVVIDGKPLTEIKEVQKLGFKVVSVFDVSQTDGEPFIVPDFGNKELDANVDDYSSLFDAISSTTTFEVKFGDISSGAKGLCSYDSKTITINNGMSQAQNIKTLLHEVAHSRLHDPNKGFDRPSRDKREVQAESVAFVVANKLGLDTSEYSFDYIAGWSSDQEIKELKESLEVIQKEASAMIEGIQEKYQELIKSKERETSFDNPDKAFANAINKGLEHPENYMFMYSANGYDHFKHIDTREYISFPQGDEINKSPTSIDNISSPADTLSQLETLLIGHSSFIANAQNVHNTVVINAFAGPGAGKTTSCLEICAELKKAGYVAEYVQEYAKELVWEGKTDMLNGSLEGQFNLLKEQLNRMDRLYGKVDFIVTDCPTLLIDSYLKEPNQAFTHVSRELFNHFDNFNYFVERDVNTFETKGRIHNLEQSIQIDKELKQSLSSLGINYGTYNHSTIDKIVSNAIAYKKGKEQSLSDNEKNSYVRHSNSKQPKYSKEENTRIVAQIKELPIQDYAQSLGFTVQQIGTYYTLKEHDSVRIDPSKNRFVRNSTGAKGSVIDFSMEFERLDKQSAISKLAKYVGADAPLPPAHVTQLNTSPKYKSDKLTLPPRAENMKNVFAYLINTRKIDSQIVSQWVHDKNLYQDTHKNCVFVTYDKDGNPEFASQRGTNTHKPFKADVPGSNYDTCHFINNNAAKLIVGEAVIDVMSVQTILQSKGRDLKGYNYLSLNGATKTNAVLNALKNSPTDTVILATDNDNAGKQARIELQALISEYDKNIKVIEYVPQNEKDWNAELVANVLKEKPAPLISDKKTNCEKVAKEHNQTLEHNSFKEHDKKQDFNLD